MSEDKSYAEYKRNAFLARLAENAERFDEMAGYIHTVAEMTKDLNIEERNLLSIAYKNVVGSRRASWRFLNSFITELRDNSIESDAEASRHLELAQILKQKIEEQVLKSTKAVIDLVTNILLPNTDSSEVQIFYYKMVGDYYRYNTEFTEGEERQNNAGSAYDNYHEATELAEQSLSPTHPLRVGLALNFSVFYYEVLNSPSRACKLAEKSYDEAIPELDSLPDDQYHDSKLIMKLLRDNLSYWNSEIDENNVDLFQDEEEEEDTDDEDTERRD